MKLIKHLLSLTVALALLVGTIPLPTVTAEASGEGATYESIQLDEEKIISTAENGGEATFSFEPIESGSYAFYSYDTNVDTHGYLYDADMQFITEDDDSGDECNFRVAYRLNAGEKYYVKCGPHNSNYDGPATTYAVKIVKLLPPQSMTIGNGDTLTAYIGDHIPLWVEFGPENCAEEDVTWHSNNEAVAYVDEYGDTSFNELGTATITATSSSGLNDSIVITVSERPKATSISISQGNYVSDYVKRTIELTVDFGPENCEYEGVIWESDNEDVAVVSEYDGRVSLLSVGTATITVTSSSGLTASCLVEAKAIPTISCDEAKTITYEGNDASGLFSFTPTVDGTYAFYSFDANTATVGEILDENLSFLVSDWYDEGGEEYYTFKVVYNMTAGTQYYLRTYSPWDNSDAQFSVKISQLLPATSVSITPDSDIEIFERRDYKLDAKLNPENALEESFTWESDDETVATVNQDGTVTAVSVGTATITVTSENDLTDSVEVTVIAPEEIEQGETKTGIVSPEKPQDVFTFNPLESGKYRVIVQNSNYIETAVRDFENEVIHSSVGAWFSFDVELDVNEKYDIVSTHLEGDESIEYTVTIERLYPATTISIGNYETRNYYTDEDCHLNITLDPENAIDEKITWQTSNPEVATIEYYNYGGGQPDEDKSVNINFVSAGTVTITATSENGLHDSAEFTVVNRPTATEIKIIEVDNPTGFVGITKPLWVNSYPENSLVGELTWKSNNETVATVNENGEVKFLTTGTVTVTATNDIGLSDTCTFTVIETPVLTLGQPALITIANNEMQYLKYIPDETGPLAFYYTEISNENEPQVHVYDQDGQHLTSSGNEDFDEFEFEADETYYIGTNYNGYYDNGDGTYYLNAVKPVPATAISIDVGSEFKGYLGTEKLLQVVYDPIYAFKETIEWTSTDDDIVSVDEEGNISLKAVGTATITATSETGLSASLEVTVEDYETIELGQEMTVTIDSNTPAEYFYFTPEEDGYYSFYSYGDENYDTYGEIYSFDMDRLADDDDGGEQNHFRVKYFLEADKTYILKARFLNDNQGSFKVCVEKTNVVTSLELVSMPTKSEYYEGFSDGDIDYDGLKLKATWSDTSVTEWEYGDSWCIDGSDISRNTEEVETTGKMVLICDVASVTLNFTIIPNPVDHIELVSKGESTTYFENFGGEINYNDDGEYYHYNTNGSYDVKVKIVYKNGTSITKYVGDEVEGYQILLDSNQYEKPWVLGTNNNAIVSYLGHKVNLPITVKKNNVKSIQYVSGKVTCIENTDGEQYETYYYYYYDVPSSITLKINYTDGTSKTAKIRDRIDGKYFDTYSNQDEKPWVLGDKNSLTVSYLGFTTKVPVSVIKNPVERVELVSSPTRKYIYGDTKFGISYENNGYELYAHDLTGLSFKVYYKNGTSKTFTHNDIDQDGMVNGFRFSTNPFLSNPQIGDSTIEARYMGCDFKYKIEVLEASHVHKADSGTVLKKATCTKLGAKLYKCTLCKSTLDTVPMPKIPHAYKPTITKATLSKNGSIVKKCSCGHVASKATIKYVKSFKLSTTSYTYNGKTKTPSVVVKDSAGKTLKKNTDYTVSYASGRKKVGTYKVTIKMKGKYSGTKTLTFKINPVKTKVSKLSAAKKSLKVTISKKSTQVTGYQIQYSTSKKFKSAKTKTISKYKTTKYTIKKLKAKKTYYVRVRTYKTVKGKKYYSSWSSYKSKKTK